MTDAQTPEIIRRTPSEISRELERRSRPDSAHKGNLKRLKTSSVSGFQRWEKENELLWAMLEDETEWLAQLFPDIFITPELFFYALEDGVVLCRLANLIQEKAEEYGKKNNVSVTGKRFKYHTSIPKKNKQLALFKSRENAQGFLTWCRQLGISDSILFESNDIVEADECREGCREVVICLMEIARRASGRFKFTPIPKLIQLEKEIEAEEQQDAENNALDQVDYGSSDEESNDSSHSPSLEDSSAPANAGNDTSSSGTKKKPKKHHHPKSELDKEVLKIIDNFNVYNIRKIKEGKYLILGKIIFVRMLNGHILLRIGGGWDTLEHYLMTHIPKAENGQIQSEATVSPSVSKTPQKSQLTKLLDKVKKEQQLKATPVSSPYRAAANKNSKQPDDSSGDDEKDITSAIRKIELSVNQNIATRRKLSKVLVEETSQKSPSANSESSRNTADINQNSIKHEQKTSEVPPNQFPQEKQTNYSRSFTKKMEDEVSRTGEFTEEISTKGELNFGSVQQIDGEKVTDVDGGSGNGGSEINEPVNGQGEEGITEHATDAVDGVSMANLLTEGTLQESPDIKISDSDPNEAATPHSLEAEPFNGVDVVQKPVSGDGDPPAEGISLNPNNADIKERSEPSVTEQSSAAENSADIPDILPGSIDNVAAPVHVTNDSDKPALAYEVSDSVPVGNAAPDPDKGKTNAHEEKSLTSPKKKPSARSAKETSKAKEASGKKETAASTAGRTKSAQSKTSTRPPPSQSGTTKTTKRPMSAAKSTTTPSTNTSPTSGSGISAKRTSPTHTAASKKPATKSDSKPTASTRQARPAKTTAFGSTISKPPPKKTTNSGRPATAPPVGPSQAKGRTVAAKVQSGLSSARPHSAKPSTRPTTAGTKDATDGGATSKGTGKPSKDVSATRETSPTKPPYRKTQVKTVTTLKTTKAGTAGGPEVKSQTIKTTKTVTEAHGKKTTKTTVKEVAATGRKPLRMTNTETTEIREAHGKKKANGSAQPKTGGQADKLGPKKPDTKSKVGSVGKVGSKGPSKSSGGPGTKKTTTKAGVKSEQKVSSHLKGTMPHPKTVKEFSNAVGISKPAGTSEATAVTPETEAKLDEELKTETTSQDEVKNLGSDKKLVSETDENSVKVIDEEFVKKEETGETQDELIAEKFSEETVNENEQAVPVEGNVKEETGSEVTEAEEFQKDEISEATDKEELLEEANKDDSGVTPETVHTIVGLESSSCANGIVSTGEKITEEVIVDVSEKASFPETEDKVAEETEAVKQGSVEQLEETPEDNTDLIQVPPQEISTTETKIETTEAWPAIDDGRELVPNEDSGEESREEMGVIVGNNSSPDVVEDKSSEELQEDILEKQKPDVDSSDRGESKATQPSVSPPINIEAQREDEQSEVASSEDNNNIVEISEQKQSDENLQSVGATSEDEVNLNQDPHLATHEATFPDTTIADQVHEGTPNVGAGDDKAKTLFGEVIQSGEVTHKDFAEWTTPEGYNSVPKEENGDAPSATVDDLLA